MLRIRRFELLALVLLPVIVSSAPEMQTGGQLRERFAAVVERRLDVPDEENDRYVALMTAELARLGLSGIPAQFMVLADRDPLVQAVFIYWKSPDGGFDLVGAAPASTGRPGAYEHFITPTGVFEHLIENPDYRAEGTRNQHGVLGLGARDMRVYDFGWQLGERGWGAGGTSPLRLLLHSTDPEHLEPRLGSIQSKGCIRIPAEMNEFIDHYGILDADYERAAGPGAIHRIFPPDREPTPWSGRYLIVVDTERVQRPAWSPAPLRAGRTN
jgi:hypothetical protein